MKKTLLLAALLGASWLNASAQAQTAQPIPAWDHQIAGATRFVLLADFANAAVLDRETGLVWERHPLGQMEAAGGAVTSCVTRAIGGRMGWRLPSIYELTTLLDPNSLAVPKLPAGHPFLVSSKGRRYWSSTRDVNWAAVWSMTTQTAEAQALDGSTLGYVWCVRAPSAENET